MGRERPAAGSRNRADARRWPGSSSIASAIASPFCTPRFTTPSAPSSGGAFARARRAWWWARAPASSRRCRISASSSSMRSTTAATSRRKRPRYNGRDVAIVRRAGRGRLRGARLGHAQSRKPLQRRARQVHAARTAGAHRAAAHARRGTDRHARRSFWKRASRPPSRAS